MENVVQTLSKKILCAVCTLIPLPSSYLLSFQLAYIHIPDLKTIIVVLGLRTLNLEIQLACKLDIFKETKRWDIQAPMNLFIIIIG